MVGSSNSPDIPQVQSSSTTRKKDMNANYSTLTALNTHVTTGPIRAESNVQCKIFRQPRMAPTP